jgi:hypothetical protein
MTAPSVYDHYRTTDGDYEDGIYRVVGTGNEKITLLRVGDADGRRVNTGELIAVSRNELDGFEKAENPDGNRSLSEKFLSVPETAYWSIRVFAGELVAHPLPASVALGLVLIGSLGDGIVPIPDIGLGALIFVGSLGLAYVGSGRM